MRLDNAGMGPHLNVGRFFDLIDQILRHGAVQRTSAHQHNDAFRIAGEVHGCLASGICPTHHVDDFALARQCLRRASAVVDTGALQFIDSRSIQPPPLQSACDHQCVAGDLTAVAQLDDAIRAFGAHANHLLRRKNFHSKTLRLGYRSPGQIVTAEP